MNIEGQTGNQPTAESARRHRGKLVTMFVIAMISAGLLIQHRVFKNSGDARLAAIKQTGLPIDVFELKQFYTLPVDATNAAGFHEQAFAMVTDWDHGDTNGPIQGDLDFGSAHPPATTRFLEQWVATNQASIALFHQGARHPVCRYSLDLTSGFYISQPHSRTITVSVKLLSWDAWLRAEAGDLDGTVHSLETALAITESLADEPGAFLQLIRSACLSTAAQRLEQIMNRHHFDDRQLTRLGRLFEGRESPGGLRAASAADMCIGLRYFDAPIQAMGMTLSPAEWFRYSATIALRKTSGSWARDRDLLLDIYSRCFKAFEKPFPSMLQDADAIQDYVETRYAGKSSWISQYFVPDMRNAVEGEARRVATLRTVQTAIAIERFRLSNKGNPPGTLDELTPRFLPTLLNDPFDGEPLRYKTLEKGFVVHSVGVDRVEDQEAVGAEANQADDLRFRVLR